MTKAALERSAQKPTCTAFAGSKTEPRVAVGYRRLPNNIMERLMQPAAYNSPTSFSDLPVLCTNRICTHLAATGPVPLVRVRTVNQDFFEESRIPVAKSVIEALKEVVCEKFPTEEGRLGEFNKYLGYVKSTNALPGRFRHAVLKELCRIVNTLPNQFFRAGWRDMVAQFNAESDEVRAALKEDMNKAWSRADFYGDGGAPFNFNRPLHYGQ